MLTPKQITDIIRSDDSLTALAAAEDWAGIVAAWPLQRLPNVRVSGRQTAVGLMEAGLDWFATTAAFDATVVGRDIKTIMQSEGGIDWADPLTQQTLQALRNDVITDQVIAVLTSLSESVEPTPTAAEISAAWQQHVAAETLVADETRHEVLLSCNRGTDGSLRVMARVTPVEFADGVLLRRGQPTVLANAPGLVAALLPIVEGLTNG
jgi:hypothetical protein